jgi:hypothetical protein
MVLEFMHRRGVGMVELFCGRVDNSAYYSTICETTLERGVQSQL